VLRRALDGLTPGVAAVIAAMLLGRVLAGLILRPQVDVTLLFAALQGFAQLLAMVITMLAIVMVTVNLGPQQGARRWITLALAISAATLAGTAARVGVTHLVSSGLGWDAAWSILRSAGLRYAAVAALLVAALEFSRREAASLRSAQQAALDHAVLDREGAEARLQLLQAQVEPHFLFNTLATVRRLYETDGVAGRAMLTHLMRYLEVALPRLREVETTLGRDAQLIDAYLRIQQIRMGRRLGFAIDIPPAMRERTIPPLMLLTLVENAIKHGVNPLPQGGSLRVSARAEDGRLLLTVADSGVGFAPGSGSGTGLANIRARLAAQFGPAAALELQHNDLGGLTATIVLPSQEPAP
jgi:hypothetical protein